MDPTLLIALLAATLSIILLVVMVVLLVLLAAVVLRSRRARAEPAPVPAPAASAAVVAPSPPRADPAVVKTTEQPRSAEPPSNMIGFFDDESSVPNLDKRPGLFNSGVPASAFNSVPPQRFDEESDGNDGEATEIFSASQLGAEFAEFLEDDEPSGRLR
ncbi:MAG: hypothetical protein H6738_04230 [Alphaproteobacteria bacterium]|nr:hypothetical protein [Alphaproteobacteria bacterium]MCB9695979.1 hypothetical protein [Alphaproteobacteria bacterium]